MTHTYLDLHVLQTVPPSNLNRDDTGSPKTAIFGGTRRARVSSQAWKRATRLAFADLLDESELGVRTKRLVELLADEVTAKRPDLSDRAAGLSEKVLTTAGFKVKTPKAKRDQEPGLPTAEFLIFLSRVQIKRLAELVIDAADSDDPQKTITDGNPKQIANTHQSVDISLFGRMIADLADLNVDAACQVAHAISVHTIDTEYDYFTAVEELSRAEETGAAMIGTVEFNSATLYRYATINVDQLYTNLGDKKATQRAIEAFIGAFVKSMPTGKQNTFAHRTLPDAIVANLRSDQPVNLVGAFESAVSETQVGRLASASAKFAEYSLAVADAFGTPAEHTWITRLGTATDPIGALGNQVSFPDLVSSVSSVVAARLAEDN